MDREQIFGIVLIAIGLILMALPAFAAALILVIVDLFLAVLGLDLIYREFKKGKGNLLSNRKIQIGIGFILLGLIFFFGLENTPFISSIEFILIGAVFMTIGSLGLKEYLNFSKLSCTIILILGITIFVVPLLTGFNLRLSTFVVGMTTLVEGILLYLHK